MPMHGHQTLVASVVKWLCQFHTVQIVHRCFRFRFYRLFLLSRILSSIQMRFNRTNFNYQYIFFEFSLMVSFNFLFVCRWKTIQMLVGRMRMAICPKWWAHTPLPKTHWSQTIQVSSLWSMFFTFRSFSIAHETPCLIEFC